MLCTSSFSRTSSVRWSRKKAVSSKWSGSEDGSWRGSSVELPADRRRRANPLPTDRANTADERSARGIKQVGRISGLWLKPMMPSDAWWVLGLKLMLFMRQNEQKKR